MSTVRVERVLTKEDAHNIAITAFEQGIGYWATGMDHLWELREQEGWEDSKEEAPDGWVLFRFRERELDDDDTSYHAATPALIARGIERFLTGVRFKDIEHSCREHPHGAKWQFEPRAFADMEDLGAMDSLEADAVIQLGWFGRLKYG